jgi:Fe2+ transport system protein FeoA
MNTLNKTQPLTELEPQVTARIAQILNGHGALQYLHEIGMHSGDYVEVVRKAPFGGPIHIRCNGQDFALGRELTAKILVEIEPESTN